LLDVVPDAPFTVPPFAPDELTRVAVVWL